MAVLVTGGAGYIGSHTCVELLNQGYDIAVLDNLSNSFETSLERVKAITAKTFDFHCIDLLDKPSLDALFAENTFEQVIHFAGLKAVGESVAQPLRYYQNNVEGTLNLLEVMKKHQVNNIVFSSSATVYGDPVSVPITEDFALSATNPYGQSKLMVENILRDFCLAEPDFKAVLLRYFNPIGAHASGTIGEHPQGVPNNLLPYISQVAIGKLDELSVFGSDYNTPDGTGVRDYIHVVDLAKGHVKALDNMAKVDGAMAINLGTGNGYSVLEMIHSFEANTQQKVAFKLVDRRPGDIASCYADAQLAEQFLGWKAEKCLADMMQDTWRWQSQNPNGFEP